MSRILIETAIMVTKLNIYSIKATSKEYIDFCVEFIGLYGIAMDRFKGSRDTLSIYSSGEYAYSMLYGHIGKWEVLYNRFPVRFKSRLPTIFEFEKIIESLKDAYISAHKKQVDLDRFHSSSAVVGFKKRMFEGFDELEIFELADRFIYMFYNVFPKVVCENCIVDDFSFDFVSESRDVELKKKLLEMYGLEFTYRFSDYLYVISKNIVFIMPFPFSGSTFSKLPHYKSDFRFIPEKMNYFYRIVNNVLTVPGHEEFTLKDKYKWLYYFIDSIFLIGQIWKDENDWQVMRNSLQKLFDNDRLVTKEALEILMSKGGSAYFDRSTFEYEQIDYKLDNGIKLSDIDKRKIEFWGKRYSDLYISSGLKKLKYDSVIYKAYLEYVREGRVFRNKYYGFEIDRQ